MADNKRKAPEIVVFEDPTTKHGPPKRRRKTPAPAEKPQEATTTSLVVTKKMMEEVEAFAASRLEGKDRKKYELQRKIALGAKPAPRPKVPLPILKGMHKKQEFRKMMTRIRQQEAGTYVKPKAPRKVRPAAEPVAPTPRVTKRMLHNKGNLKQSSSRLVQNKTK